MTEAEIRRRGLIRYLLFQIPGWMLAAAVAYGAHAGFGVRADLAFGGWLLWLAKDAVFYPFVRRAYEPHPAPEPSAALIGRPGVATERIDPEGYVRVGSELWRAEVAPPEAVVEVGGSVVVRAVRGFTLLVERAPDPDTAG